MYDQYRWTRISYVRNRILSLYEPVQPYLLLEIARRLNVEIFVDVGANIGAYSIFMASLASVREVHAFEPAKATFLELQKNVALNSAAKVRVHSQGVSDSAKTVTFGVVGQYSGANSIVQTSIHNKSQFAAEHSIDCVSLDDTFSYRNKLLCLKIDVEGHEFNVLSGASELLRTNTAALQLEDYAAGDSRVANLLAEFGYRKVFAIGPDSYFCNADVGSGDADRVAILESAIGQMIRSNVAQSTQKDGGRPIRLNMPGGIALDLSGRSAAVARGLRRMISRKNKS